MGNNSNPVYVYQTFSVYNAAVYKLDVNIQEFTLNVANLNISTTSYSGSLTESSAVKGLTSTSVTVQYALGISQTDLNKLCKEGSVNAQLSSSGKFWLGSSNSQLSSLTTRSTSKLLYIIFKNSPLLFKYFEQNLK